ncbi:hypothetical protein [Acinetobacter entericus]|uniref:Uncharacterized protein n=1 Tax=Acinetobacter entericus TaxID=2989714 RepID=A0ABT3NEG6_9GAMM|nr:hypothetical protein [Acinetobacter entericus]MCW8037907.1 hypothetical protein [Acinetobacter entericus]
MDYLKAKLEPKGASEVHEYMMLPFAAFVMNDGYIPVEHCKKKKAIFIKEGEPSIVFGSNGSMNDHAQARYRVFLKVYLKHGAPFMRKLRSQIKVKKSADAA